MDIEQWFIFFLAEISFRVLTRFSQIQESRISSNWSHLRLLLLPPGEVCNIQSRTRLFKRAYSTWAFLPPAMMLTANELSTWEVNAPEQGEEFEVIANDYQKFILPGLSTHMMYFFFNWHVYMYIGLTHWQHPSFFAYFPTACTFEGILGDLYASSTCNPGFNVN